MLMKNIVMLCFSLLFSPLLLAQWSAGIATIIPSNPYLGTDTEIRVLPIVTYEGKRLSWRGPSLAYKLTGFERGEPSFALSLNLAPNELDTNDSDRLDGINDRDLSFMFGASYTHPFDFSTVSFSLETDISNKHKGHRAVAGLPRTLFAHAKRKWMVTLGAELEYLSDDYADYYFGVDLDEQNNSIFSEYQVGSVLQPGITLGGYYRISKQWNVVANLRWQSLPTDIKNSAIVDGSGAVNGIFGLLYAF
jgi:outer membrane protein